MPDPDDDLPRHRRKMLFSRFSRHSPVKSGLGWPATAHASTMSTQIRAMILAAGERRDILRRRDARPARGSML
jgi:hypothetical protein